MSQYVDAVASYRDTTKWLVSFVPIGALVAAAATTGPGLLTSVQTATGVRDWLSDRWPTATAAGVLVVAIGAITYYGAKMLSVTPKDIGDIQKPEYADTLAKAIGAGVTAPEFFDKNSFDASMADLAHAWDGTTPIPDDDPTLTRLRAAVEALRQWSVFDAARKAYSNFLRAFVIGTAAILVALVVAPAKLDTSAVIDEPVAVQVQVSTSGTKDLFSDTGCSSPTTTVFHAVSGTWEEPKLAANGPGCRFAATWSPEKRDAQILPLSSRP